MGSSFVLLLPPRFSLFFSLVLFLYNRNLDGRSTPNTSGDDKLPRKRQKGSSNFFSFFIPFLYAEWTATLKPQSYYKWERDGLF
jgi:hypothetical protein